MLKRILVVMLLITQFTCWCSRSTLADDGHVGDGVANLAPTNKWKDFLAAPRIDDSRTAPPKNLNGHFPFQVPDNPAAWESRSQQLRTRVLVATGLWPMPEKTPLNAWIGEKIQRKGFTVQKVSFESLPGHHVTGLLFRPDEELAENSRVGVLCPHGHGGRTQKYDEAGIAKKLATGEEHFAESGQMPKLARCATLARMGCSTFIFDMLGYADSIQIDFAVAHRHADPRPEEEQPTPEGWVMFSPEAEHRLQSIMGLQTWNAIRALDFVESLPEVDPERLAVTGNSGGGTQTILLGAIDPRVKASFPNGMVSTSMQGGCYCENCNYLRIGTGNVELAALMAPKPQAMTAVDDWTRDMMSDGYPQMRWLYAMIGNESDVYCREMMHLPHNFGYVARATMYQWMNKHMKLGLDDPVVEEDYQLLTEDELTVWNEDEHPAPKNTGVGHEREVCSWLDKQSGQAIQLPEDSNKAKKHFTSIIGGGWEVMLDPVMAPRSQLKMERSQDLRHDDVDAVTGVLVDDLRMAKLPIAVFRPIVPDGAQAQAGPFVIWVDPAGMQVAAGQGQELDPKLVDLVKAGATVVTGDWWNKARLVDEKRHYSAFTYAYNRTTTSERVRDLLSVIAWAKSESPAGVRVLATADAGAWAAGAISFAGGSVDKAVLDTGGFRFASVRSYKEPAFVPGAVKYQDVPALLAGCAPTPLRLFGESGNVPEITQRLYDISDAGDKLNSRNGKIEPSDLLWLAH